MAVLLTAAISIGVGFTAAARKKGEDPVEAEPQAATRQRLRPARLDVIDSLSFTIAEQARISNDVRAEYDSAVGLLEQQQYDQGISLLVDLTAKAPELTAPYINLGMAYARVGDLERAESSFKAALERNPEHPVVLNEIGLLYRETGRFAAARESYEKALAVHEGFHFAHRNLAILCDIYLNDLPCALAHYEAYSQAVPDDKEAAIWVADLRSRVSQ